MNELREYYERQDTEELLEFATKDLTDEARVVLNQVLRDRQVSPEEVTKFLKVVDKQRVDEREFNEQLSEPPARLLAFLIDGIACSMIVYLLSSPLAFISEAVQNFVFLGMFWSYMLVRDALPGQGLGKRLMKLRVTDSETGKKCSWSQSFWRNVSHFVFLIDAIFILGKKRMRLGDIIAGTVVVRGAPITKEATNSTSN